MNAASLSAHLTAVLSLLQSFRYGSLRIHQGDNAVVQVHARETYQGKVDVYSDIRVKASSGPADFWYARAYAFFKVKAFFSTGDGETPFMYDIAVVKWYAFARGDEDPLDPLTMCPAVAEGNFEVIDVACISALACVVRNFRGEDCARIPRLVNVWVDV